MERDAVSGSICGCSRCAATPRYGTLGHYPAGQHSAGAKRPVWDWDSGKYLGEIDEAPYTYNAPWAAPGRTGARVVGGLGWEGRVRPEDP